MGEEAEKNIIHILLHDEHFQTNRFIAFVHYFEYIVARLGKGFVSSVFFMGKIYMTSFMRIYSAGKSQFGMGENAN